MTRGALTVRRCDCAEMHMIPIAYQLPESRPIAYQDITHVNDMRSARPLARRDAARSVSGRCGAVSQRQAMRDTWRIAVSDSLTLFLSGIALTQRSQGAVSASQRKSGAGKCSKISDLR
jgi:hypothetical protein